MAITSAICKSYREELFQGIHQSASVYKIALFTNAASLDADTTSYTGQTGEVANGGGYTTGGQVLSGFTTDSDDDIAWLTFDNPTWPSASITARGAVIYNSSLGGKNTIAVINFGVDITSTGASFTLIFPTADADNALIRIS